MDYHHRSGRNKQSNKKHKAVGHVSKRSQDRKFHGRMPAAADGAEGGGRRRLNVRQRSKVTGSKEARALFAKQTRQRKRAETLMAKRLGGGQGPPQTVAFLALGPTANPVPVASALCALSADAVVGEGAALVGSPVTAVFPEQRHRITALLPPDRELQGNLEAAKVADVLVLVVSVEEGAENATDELGDLLLTTLRASGMPSIIGVIQGLGEHSAKKQHELRRLAMRYFETEFGEDVKVVNGKGTTEDSQVPKMLLRALASVKPKPLSWLEPRSYMVAHDASFHPESEDGETGVLRVFGYLRGKPLGGHQLACLPDAGAYQIRRILGVEDPCPKRRRGDKILKLGEDGVPEWRVVTRADETGEEPEVLAEIPQEEREPLLSWVPADEVPETEGGWADEEDAKAALRERARTGGVVETRVVRKPKGVSDYQAAWLSDTDDDGDDDDEADDDEGMGDGMMGHGATVGGAEEMKGGDESRDGSHDEYSDDGALDDGMTIGGLDKEVVAEEVERLREKRLADEEVLFPNEVDSPLDISARERFARYTGMQSFRTSAWDSKLMLPKDYGRLFQLPSFHRAQRRAKSIGRAAEDAMVRLETEHQEALKSKKKAAKLASRGVKSKKAGDAMAEAPPGGAAPPIALGSGFVASGHFVCIELEGVSKSDLEGRNEAVPLIVGFLLHHENRTTVLHFNVTRFAGYEEPIKSRSELEFHYGFRRVTARPIFSQQSLLSDKHKFDRYFQAGRWTVASIYGPLTYMPTTVLVYKKMEDGSLQLVGTGAAMAADPDRIVLKETILTGFPVKCKKRSAVVKYMFHDPDDIRWYKPFELWTKWGLHGHIKEPLGTHGLMKCYFDRYIKNQDTVCLSLYKRVYPKYALGTGPEGGSGDKAEAFTYDVDRDGEAAGHSDSEDEE